jgi:hypothetical protein
MATGWPSGGSLAIIDGVKTQAHDLWPIHAAAEGATRSGGLSAWSPVQVGSLPNELQLRILDVACSATTDNASSLSSGSFAAAGKQAVSCAQINYRSGRLDQQGWESSPCPPPAPVRRACVLDCLGVAASMVSALLCATLARGLAPSRLLLPGRQPHGVHGGCSQTPLS